MTVFLLSVVTRTRENKSIIGDEEFTITVPMLTMCSRICLKSATCELFNFNPVSKKCTGYSAGVAYEDNPYWEVWEVKKV